MTHCCKVWFSLIEFPFANWIIAFPCINNSRRHHFNPLTSTSFYYIYFSCLLFLPLLLLSFFFLNRIKFFPLTWITQQFHAIQKAAVSHFFFVCFTHTLDTSNTMCVWDYEKYMWYLVKDNLFRSAANGILSCVQSKRDCGVCVWITCVQMQIA